MYVYMKKTFSPPSSYEPRSVFRIVRKHTQSNDTSIQSYPLYPTSRLRHLSVRPLPKKPCADLGPRGQLWGQCAGGNRLQLRAGCNHAAANCRGHVTPPPSVQAPQPPSCTGTPFRRKHPLSLHKLLFRFLAVFLFGVSHVSKGVPAQRRFECMLPTEGEKKSITEICFSGRSVWPYCNSPDLVCYNSITLVPVSLLFLG